MFVLFVTTSVLYVGVMEVATIVHLRVLCAVPHGAASMLWKEEVPQASKKVL